MLFAFLVLADYTAQMKANSGLTPCKQNETGLLK
jgi:hypothetical protein